MACKRRLPLPLEPGTGATACEKFVYQITHDRSLARSSQSVSRSSGAEIRAQFKKNVLMSDDANSVTFSLVDTKFDSERVAYFEFNKCSEKCDCSVPCFFLDI